MFGDFLNIAIILGCVIFLLWFLFLKPSNSKEPEPKKYTIKHKKFNRDGVYKTNETAEERIRRRLNKKY
jgi:hypothetical protein